MSRKTVKWRRLALQNDNHAELFPHRATGRARFRSMELDDVTLERAFGKVCCRPMKDEKRARIEKVLADAAKPKTKRGW